MTGPCRPQELGVTLPHEHLFIDRSRDYGLDAFLGDEGLATRELELFSRAGGGALVECSTAEIGRNPDALVSVSLATGVRVVMGCGHYRRPYIDSARLDRQTTDQVAEEIIAELREGVGHTGVRPGVIGEIGSNGPRVAADEERSFRAAARAHLATGVTITTHAALFPVGLEQLGILTHEGVPAPRVVIGHCDTVYDQEYHLELARRGCFVQFDTLHVSHPYDLERRVAFVVALVASGHRDQVLLSHDICLRSHWTSLGGQGYTFLLSEFVPRLRAAGLTEADVEQIIRLNPQRALSGEL